MHLAHRAPLLGYDEPLLGHNEQPLKEPEFSWQMSLLSGQQLCNLAVACLRAKVNGMSFKCVKLLASKARLSDLF